MRGQAGQSSRGDRPSEFLSLTAGRNFAEGRGNVALAVEWSSSDALYSRQRESLTGAFSGRRFFVPSEEWWDDPNGSDGIADTTFYDGGLFDGTIAWGGLVGVMASADPASEVYCGDLAEPIRSQRCLPNDQPRIFSFDANGNLVETIPDVDLRPFGTSIVRVGDNPGGLTTRAETGQLVPGLDRYSANLLAHLDVSDAFTPFIEAKFVHIDAVQVGGPSFWRGSIRDFFFGENDTFSGTELKCSNPFLSAQALGVLQTLGQCATPDLTFEMSRLNLDFGSRGELHDRDTYPLRRRRRRRSHGEIGATKSRPTTAASTPGCARSTTWWCSTSMAIRTASCSRLTPYAIPRAKSCAASTPMRTRRTTVRIACRSTSSVPAGRRRQRSTS